MILERILVETRRRVALLSSDFPAPSAPVRSLEAAIRSVRGRNAVIGELKYATPLQGPFPHPPAPEVLARELVKGGCIALSVVTEPAFFGGDLSLLKRVREVVDVPLLRKDFILDLRQIGESRAAGADAVLLLARVLGDRLPDFVDRSRAAGLEPLVEVHSPEEARYTLSTDASLIGINHRDLGTLSMDMRAAERLSSLYLTRGKTVVLMSGIQTPEDLRRIRPHGHAFLIGSAFMRSGTPRETAEGFVSA